MKKVILFAVILFAGVSVVKAVTPGTITEGELELTLKLQPFQSIVIGGTDGSGGVSTGSNVVLNYVTATNYKEGVSTTMNDHISVVAAGKYAVWVKSKENNFTGDGTVLTSTIKVIAANSQGEAQPTDVFNPVQLSNVEKLLFSSSVGSGTGKTYNVTYEGAGENAYVDKLVDNKETTYETTVLYTIAVE